MATSSKQNSRFSSLKVFKFAAGSKPPPLPPKDPYRLANPSLPSLGNSLSPDSFPSQPATPLSAQYATLVRSPSPSPSYAPSSRTTLSPPSASQDLLGGLGGAPSAPSPAPPSTGAPAHTAFNKNDLLLTLQVQRNSSGTGAQILARFRNESNFSRINGAGLQAAVPKSQRLQLSAINKADLDGGEEGTQAMRIAAVNGVSFFPCKREKYISRFVLTKGNRHSHPNYVCVSV